MGARHVCLLVEDDAEALDSIVRVLDVFDIDCLTARSFSEARELVDEGKFCFLLSDLSIFPDPEAVKPEPAPEFGYQLIEYARKRYPRCNADNRHLLPILVLSSLDTPDLRQGMRSGADDFLTKPIGSNRVPLKDTIREWLEKAGRTDHAKCAEIMKLARGAPGSLPPAMLEGRARLGVTGKTFGKKTEITIDGREMQLSNGLFGPLLKLIEGRLAGREWTTRDALGAEPGEGWRGAHNLQKELKPLLGDRPLLKNNGAKGYRLHDAIDLDRIAASPLVKGGEEKFIRNTAKAIQAIQSKRRRVREK
ncbi:MAG TPA: response regulator [Polyangiaceae bacterium]|jgi:CheY-like chemotaxis protein